MTDSQILRLPAVVRMTGVSRSRIYEYMKRQGDRFPQPLKIGDRSVGWRRSEVEAWLNARERAGSAGS